MTRTLRIGLVGAGYMGRAHARVVSSIGRKYGCRIEFIVDPDTSKAEAVASEYGGKVYESLSEAIGKHRIDAAIIASPTNTHLQILDQLLGNGVEYVLVEKPIGNSLVEAERLSKKYGENRLSKVMVGHIERFNPAFMALLDSLRKDVLGEPITMISRRVGPYTPRIKDTGVILDLAIHDIDLSLMISGKEPIRIHSFAYKRHSDKYEDSALIFLDYGSMVHSIEANRITPYKERSMTVTGTKGVARINFIEQEMSFYTGEWVMKRVITRREPLLVEDEYFIERIISGRAVEPSFYDGLRSLRIALKSLELSGLSNKGTKGSSW